MEIDLDTDEGELFALAKKLGMKDYEEMQKQDLVSALQQRLMAQSIAKDLENEVKVKFVRRTNIPWKRKYYFVSEKRYKENKEAIKGAPNQVQLILRYMVEAGITTPQGSQMGPVICDGAIKFGLRTKIKPAVLFAYYRKDMESLALEFAGYNLEQD